MIPEFQAPVDFPSGYNDSIPGGQASSKVSSSTLLLLHFRSVHTLIGCQSKCLRMTPCASFVATASCAISLPPRRIRSSLHAETLCVASLDESKLRGSPSHQVQKGFLPHSLAFCTHLREADKVGADLRKLIEMADRNPHIYQHPVFIL